jgi:hypothetical protein
LASVTLNASPTITSQPASQTVLEGQTATFAVAASGPSLTYRWQRNTTLLGTGPLLFVANASLADTATNYYCVVTSGSCSVTSRVVALTVLADFDRDGMADYWEAAYGFNTNNAADALLDNDGDGLINRVEFQRGSNPFDPQNSLKLAALLAPATSTEVTLVFNVPAGLAQLQTTNYALRSGATTPISILSVVPAAENPNAVRLRLAQPLSDTQNYTLTVANPAITAVPFVPTTTPAAGFSKMCPNDLTVTICAPATTAHLDPPLRGKVCFGNLPPEGQDIGFRWYVNGMSQAAKQTVKLLGQNSCAYLYFTADFSQGIHTVLLRLTDPDDK